MPADSCTALQHSTAKRAVDGGRALWVASPASWYLSASPQPQTLTKDTGAASAMGWHQDTAGVTRHPDWLGQPQGLGTVLASFHPPLPSAHPLFFLPSPKTAALGYCQPRAAGCKGRQSFSVVPFPWHRAGRKAAVLLIAIYTVASYLRLPNEETWGGSRRHPGKLLVLALSEGTTGACN